MLRFTARWLDSPYHGEEWPPSPLRLFQAMVAGLYTGHEQIGESAVAAIHYLESLKPPAIFAADAQDLEPFVTSVPNNDGEIIFRLLAKGKDTDALKAKSSLRTLRCRHPKEISCVVVYDWPSANEMEKHLPALERLATSVTAIGQGIDLAWVTMEVTEKAPPFAGSRYWPDATGERMYQVPYPGVTEILKNRYEQCRNRIDRLNGNVSGIREPNHPPQHYRSDQDLPGWRKAFFTLKDPIDVTKSASFEGGNGARVAAMVRHAVQRAARQAGMSDSLLATLMGHGGDRGNGRIRIMPIPNVGHRHADGRIRRVMLIAPLSLDKLHWGALLHRLVGMDLTPVDQKESTAATLVSVATDDRIIPSYHLEHARTWTTAVPAILPGHDSQRLQRSTSARLNRQASETLPENDLQRRKPRPEKILRRMLQLAGISETMVVSATLEPGPMLAGSGFANGYFIPDHLRHWPISHFTIEFNKAVSGPLFFGGGSGYGFGLMLPFRRETVNKEKSTR